MGIEVRRSADRFVTAGDGRLTLHSFSFGPHYDPANLGFARLVCHNDDLVSPGSGYPDHPHQDMEIVTWVLAGALAHRDSSGNAGVTVPGRVQVMSAGRGIVHSEMAEPGAGPTRFVQTWVRPDHPGGEPRVVTADVHAGAGWTPLASGTPGEGALSLGTRSATLWVADAGVGTRLALPDVPEAHLFVAGGAVTLAGRLGEPRAPLTLAEGDAARMREAGGDLEVTAPGQLMLWTFG